MKVKKEILTTATLKDARWESVLARDSSADSQFVYSVKTTGVYCKPSCPSRPAKPENVTFYKTAADAEQAGFRPCKRCKPNQPTLAIQHAATITELCQFIQTAEHSPTLHELSLRSEISPYHLHRIFKSITGVTPKAYSNAHRAERIRHELQRSPTVTDAIYSAGFNSNGRFYTTSDQLLGMSPSKYRACGLNIEIRFALGECSLGSILVAQSERGICAISLGDDPSVLLQDLQNKFSSATLIGGDASYEKLIAQVVGFIESPKLGLNLPLDIRGTAFQQRVWQALQKIPVGETASYTDIAQRIGAPKSVRAVAGACAANVLAVAIPCHRVVRNDGGLSGYRWGVERKRALLKRERQK
jgi:AraC family transcriptional regulator, regulatory protein of adaptative response / methylated-DNA-[protein]-cysteine methyltransferase